MFNWTTTTILNSLKDLTTGADLVKVWKGAEAGDGDLKAGFSGSYPVIKIKRDYTFESRYIAKIYKAYASDPTLCEITVDCDKISSAIAAADRPAHVRLSFYVALEGSEESIYANDGYQKGKPFSVGFEVTTSDTGATIAAKIKKNAEKYGVVMYGKKIFDLSVSGTTLTIKGTHEYQRFKNAVVAVDDVIDENILDFFEDGDKTSEGAIFTLVARGTNGFGTSHQLMKDLRLPTAHNTKWLALKEDEKVAVGAKYNQYIITYCAPSMANPGFTVIGQHNDSVTTHVFWVNQAIDADFKAYLTDLGVTVEEVNKEDGTAANVNADNEPTTKATANAGTKYSENHEQSEEVSHSKSKKTSAATGD
jgi:hypothetical protein